MTGRIEKTVFISYRRTSLPWALAVFQHLTSQGYDVFFDYLSIPSGDFEKIIIENIRGRAHFIVILTPSALERCNEAGDWLRREIETAMEEKRNVVPLMVESFDFGNPITVKALTGKLENLRRYNALRVPSEYFFEAMGRLRNQFLNVPLDAVVHPISEGVQQIAEEHQVAASDTKPVRPTELTAQELIEQGYLNERNKNYEEAVRFFTEAIRLQPDFIKPILLKTIYQKNINEFELQRFRLTYELLNDLRPPVIIQDLKSALENLAHKLIQINKDKLKIMVDIETNGQHMYPESVERQLFRIVEEACTNTIVHADAANLNISGKLGQNKIELNVEDDGIGIDPTISQNLESMLATKSFGLAEMFERANIIDAKVEISSKPVQGTHIRVIWESDLANSEIKA
jgi:hypothetical protein